MRGPRNRTVRQRVDPFRTRWIKNPEPKATRDKPATKIDRGALAQDVCAYPASDRYERAHRLGVIPQGIGRALKRLGASYKKPSLIQGQRRKAAYFPK